ncbi:MAG: ThuA domain-containing protein [Planctomycetota bacterium]|jgi:type 1 glutamine amidotransferase
MKALILWGGWDGHEPGPVADVLESELKAKGLEVVKENSLDPLTDAKLMKTVDVVSPCWTMGEMSDEQWSGLDAAVQAGTGIAGLHGGMGDAFRGNLTYQMMVGGQFVDHPGGIITYRVNVVDRTHPVTAGMEDFDYESEQYYMLVNPANRVLATTAISMDGCTMPTVWTKNWGKGRVFYSALGHVAQELKDYPDVLAMTVRGLIWAAHGKVKAEGKCCHP